MSHDRASDLKLLNELLDKHADQLTEVESEAFAGMRFDLQVETKPQLTPDQRGWALGVRERIVPQYANLVSRGLVPQGTPTAESKALDAMLAAPKVTRPPPMPRPSGAPQRASRRHCGRQDEGCYAFVNGDCSCGCCR